MGWKPWKDVRRGLKSFEDTVKQAGRNLEDNAKQELGNLEDSFKQETGNFEDQTLDYLSDFGDELDRILKPESGDRAADAQDEQVKLIQDIQAKQEERIVRQASLLASQRAGRLRARRVGRRSLVSSSRLGGVSKLGSGDDYA
jgi:hypothetical protein